MGGKIRFTPQAAVGEPVTILTPEFAYRLWSSTYDAGLNPVLALEQRILRGRLAVHHGMTVLDLGTGTGRWLEHALSLGARAVGVDLSPAMLGQAAAKGMAQRLVQANLSDLPFRDAFADLAICSMTLGYVPEPEPAFRDMARVARLVIVSDLHPEALRAGWTRGFRVGGRRYQIESHDHSRGALNRCAEAAGLTRNWEIEAGFGEQEFGIFEQAGKASIFETARRIPAVLISCWTRP